jgi:(p)ppGpp synthase/HD superfamily hydrolase
MRAREEVVAMFSGITRKVPKGALFQPKPYATHQEATAAKVHWWGYSTAVEIAALHHDSPEDLKDLYTLARLKKQYGAGVASWVDWVTHQDKSLPWAERQKRYLDRLKRAPEEAVAISCADKLVNMEDTIVILKAGYSIDTILKAGTQAQLEKLRELGSLYSQRLPLRIVEEYMRTYRELEKLTRNPNLKSE